jgi:hypothetical protein
MKEQLMSGKLLEAVILMLALSLVMVFTAAHAAPALASPF